MRVEKGKLGIAIDHDIQRAMEPIKRRHEAHMGITCDIESTGKDGRQLNLHVAAND